MKTFKTSIFIVLLLLNFITFSAVNETEKNDLTFVNEVIKFINGIFGDAENNEKLILEKTIPTERNRILTVNAVTGDIHVFTHVRNEVIVKIYGTEDINEKFVFSAFETSNGVEVTSEFKHNDKKVKNSKTRFEIQIPADYNIDLKTKGGNILAEDINGRVTLKTMGGNINIKNITGNIDGSTQGGNIKLSNIKGYTDISTLGGNISAKDFDGNIKVETRGGNIILDGKNGSVNANTLGGNIELNYSGENSGIELTTKGGSITLNIPYSINADADIRTTIGSINSDFGTPKKNSISSELITTFNTGGSKLKVKTFAGDITIKKK